MNDQSSLSHITNPHGTIIAAEAAKSGGQVTGDSGLVTRDTEK